ncbi:MAG TPA: bifunctional 4-hydroxy-2-oxoglutarate aldolase/2-dehydro-3-deoxy-phosphogluconate aldolase [Sphingomicrobium sp.]|nr:bifunctional 4-hydroxy-2-oxoglutarate aldolase/2-dehydro-3-deoxy-phosphogluconate aldolase [Sphingomicrobium sp.]
MGDIDRIMRLAPVIPVLVIEDVRHAVPIARALVGGGLRVLEVTCRTAAAMDAIREMRQVEGAIVGAGTVLHASQMEKALEAGATFIVSPGLTERLADAATANKVPFLPGIATATDIMRGLDFGFRRFKFFPAEAAGGIDALKALTGPFGDVRFCPTGGIKLSTAGEWLSLPEVLCVGGSWLVAKGEPDQIRIREQAQGAAALRHAKASRS